MIEFSYFENYFGLKKLKILNKIFKFFKIKNFPENLKIDESYKTKT